MTSGWVNEDSEGVNICDKIFYIFFLSVMLLEAELVAMVNLVTSMYFRI